MINRLKGLVINTLGTILIVALTAGGIYWIENNKLPKLATLVGGTEQIKQYTTTLAQNITKKKTPTPIPTVTPEYTIILPSETPTPTIYMSPTPSPTVTPDPYKYRQYTTSLIFYLPDLKIPFPKVITSIQDKDIIKMACDPVFQGGFYGPYNDAFYLDEYEKNISYLFRPSERYHLMKTALAATGEKIIHTAQFCRIEGEENIVMYGVDGSKSSNLLHVGIIKDDVMSPLVTIHNSTDDVYFSCEDPLLLTKEKVLYIACSKADGNVVNGKTTYLVYSVDLKNISSKLEYECHYDRADITCNP